MAAAHDYDGAAELARFHDSRGGVRGLVESGVTAVLPLFSTPTATMPPAAPQAPATPSSPAFTIPVVDLSLPRPDAVALVRAAARSRGLFHATNHRVPAGIVAAALAAARAFHEQPLAARSAFYTSLDDYARPRPVAYSTIPITQQQQQEHGGVDAPALPWRDSLRVRFGPGEPDLGDLQPPWFRDALRVYQRVLRGFGEEVAGLLSEALGVGAARLEQELRVRGWLMACHYYPPCPEPASVVGSREHTDPGVFTVLAQDGVGGLQVRYEYDDHDGGGGGGDDDGGGVWVDVVPVAGALLVNIGDLLKVISNDEYKSVEHRVVIKSRQDARVSIALFFNPAKRGDSDRFGPLPELVTAERPAEYGSFTFFEFMSSRRKFGHSRSSIQCLKVVSNDEYKSVEHRVVIKSKQDARVSIALFFNPAKRGDSDRFGPLPELMTAKRPAEYGNFTFFVFMSSRRKFGHS